MKKVLFWLGLVILLPTAKAGAQTIDRLDERNGFKDLILGSNVGNYPHLVFARAHEDQAGIPNGKIFSAKEGYYKQIGTVSIDDIEVTVYGDQILGISVKTSKDPNLLKGLRRAFGKESQTLGSTSFVWKTDKMSLVFRSISKSQLELYYDSIAVREAIKEDKDQKVQDIADDF